MAAIADPMADILAQLATLTAANANLQGQIAGMATVAPGAVPTIFARTPAFRAQADLLDFGKKTDLSVFTDGSTPVFEGEERFDVKAETLGPFLKRLLKKATDQGWNDAGNGQQIVLFNIIHNGTALVIDLLKEYGRIDVLDLRAQCERFMIGADSQHRAHQNNQMMQACVWDSLTLSAQQRLSQFESEYTFGGVICGPLLLKIIIRMATMDSRATISIIRAQLNDIDAYAAGVNGDVEKVTEYFSSNLERLKASGANLDDEVDVLFKGLKAVPCAEFRSYINRKEEQYTDGAMSLTARELVIVAQQKYSLMKTKGTFLKSQTVDAEIVAMRAEVNKLRGDLALSRNVEQAATPTTGEGTKKQRQKQDEAWKKVPPTAGEPATKMIRKKEFHWCIHHMAWTVHNPKDCKLGMAPTSAVTPFTNVDTTPPSSATANAATLSATNIMSILGGSLGLATDSDY